MNLLVWEGRREQSQAASGSSIATGRDLLNVILSFLSFSESLYVWSLFFIYNGFFFSGFSVGREKIRLCFTKTVEIKAKRITAQYSILKRKNVIESVVSSSMKGKGKARCDAYEEPIDVSDDDDTDPSNSDSHGLINDLPAKVSRQSLHPNKTSCILHLAN